MILDVIIGVYMHADYLPSLVYLSNLEGVRFRPCTRLPWTNAGAILRVYVLMHTYAQNFNDTGGTDVARGARGGAGARPAGGRS